MAGQQAKQHYGVPLERSDQLMLRPHRNSCKPESFAQWLEGLGADDLLAVDLFSGAGGLSLGLERAGWTVAAAVDHDERALETHTANFPGLSIDMDLGDPAERDRLIDILEPARGRIDLVAGGPPCQPFSRAGRSKIRSLVEHHGRDAHDLRKELWRAYLDVVQRIRPRAVLMENVPDMGLSDDFTVVRAIEQSLEDMGYATQVRLVDAWRYQVPQHRKRLILLARNDVERFEWRPDQKRVTLRDAIGDLPQLFVAPHSHADGKPHIPPRERVGERALEYTQPETSSPFATSMRKGMSSESSQGIVWDHMTRRVREDDWEIFTAMESTTLYSQIDPGLMRYKADHFTDKYKKLAWDDLSRSITAHIAKDGYWYIHPDQNRTLTVREAARVQTFPDWFRFAGTRSDAFRQIGNAVPPLLGEAAAEVLRPVENVDAPVGGLRPRWSLVREQLELWAAERRDSGYWYQLPGDHMTQLTAAVVALLSNTRMKHTQLEAIAAVIRDATSLSPRIIADLEEAAPTAAAHTQVKRLAELKLKRAIWASKERLDEIAALLHMKPAEASLFRLLSNEDVLWVGQTALRVAARLNNSESNRTNRLSDGRVDLIRVIGAGKQAPLRMAALRLLGSTVCLPQKPVCVLCPVNAFCEGQENVSDDLFRGSFKRATENQVSVPTQARSIESHRDIAAQR